MATWYISPTGNDSTGNGSSGSPWSTIAKTQSSTSTATGDTVYMASGTYAMASDNFNKGLSYISSTPLGAIVDGSSGNYAWTVTGNVTVSFTDVKIKSVTRTAGDNFIFGASNGVTGYWVFTRCYFKDLKFSRKLLTSGYATSVSGYTLQNCILDNVWQTADGDYQGFFGCGGGGTVTTANIYNNIIYIPNWDANGNSSLFNNTTTTVTYNLKNNIIYNTSGKTIAYRSLTNGTFNLYNNDAYLITSFPAANSNITSDPLFVDYVNGNFNLRPTSPCRANGVSV